MFGVGFGELVLLALVALLIMGPRRLPEAARAAGQVIGRTRTAWHSLKREFQAEMDAEHNRRIIESADKGENSERGESP